LLLCIDTNAHIIKNSDGLVIQSCFELQLLGKFDYKASDQEYLLCTGINGQIIKNIDALIVKMHEFLCIRSQARLIINCK